MLGADFTAQTVPMRPDGEGPVVATLVRRLPQDHSDRAVLYVHGFVDYFFHPHVADEWVRRGFDFYALDLRKHGRSLRGHQTPNFALDFTDYAEELDEAIRIIRAEGHRQVVVQAHSTGGLIAVLWAHARRKSGALDALVLNSPFFDINRGWFEKVVVTRLMEVVGRVAPRLVVSALASSYARALHATNGGEWTFDPAWKSLGRFPVRAGWFRAVRRAQARVARGLSVDVPVLVCASARSGDGSRPGPQLADSDCVLNVDDMVRCAPLIGPDVSIARIDGGLHDLALSPQPVRARYFDAVSRWLDRALPAAAAPGAGAA